LSATKPFESEAPGTPVALSSLLEANMILALGIILFVAWLLGLVAFHVTGWFIHLLLVVALVSVILHFVTGRRNLA
jgi:hypothetical protein